MTQFKSSDNILHQQIEDYLQKDIDKDVEIIMEQARCRRRAAQSALRQHCGNVANAIAYLLNEVKESNTLQEQHNNLLEYTKQQ